MRWTPLLLPLLHSFMEMDAQTKKNRWIVNVIVANSNDNDQTTAYDGSARKKGLCSKQNERNFSMHRCQARWKRASALLFEMRMVSIPTGFEQQISPTHPHFSQIVFAQANQIFAKRFFSLTNAIPLKLPSLYLSHYFSAFTIGFVLKVKHTHLIFIKLTEKLCPFCFACHCFTHLPAFLVKRIKFRFYEQCHKVNTPLVFNAIMLGILLLNYTQMCKKTQRFVMQWKRLKVWNDGFVHSEIAISLSLLFRCSLYGWIQLQIARVHAEKWFPFFLALNSFGVNSSWILQSGRGFGCYWILQLYPTCIPFVDDDVFVYVFIWKWRGICVVR